MRRENYSQTGDRVLKKGCNRNPHLMKYCLLLLIVIKQLVISYLCSKTLYKDVLENFQMKQQQKINKLSDLHFLITPARVLKQREFLITECFNVPFRTLQSSSQEDTPVPEDSQDEEVTQGLKIKVKEKVKQKP